jgi:colicin import membrane protein
MAEETDGVGEMFDDSLRVALTMASQFGERISRLREQMSRMREASAQQEYRELESRFEAERGAARASLVPVQQAEWWDTGGVDDIAQAHETATVWRDHDETAREAGDAIRREVSERYGIDVDAPGAGQAAVAAALRDAERDRAEARAERERSGEELTASQILFANADRHEREAQEWAERDWNSGDFDGADIADPQEFERRDDDRTQAAEATGQSRAEGDDAGLDYDSSERRRQFAASLKGKADQKTIDARILADEENAQHPREAVRTQPGRAAKPRKRAKGVVQQRTRGGLTR